MEERTVRFCVSLPESLLNELDERVICKGYASRSEFVRDLIRDLLSKERWEDNQEAIGVLSIVYDHHDRELLYKLLDLQHKHYMNVLCSTHLHLDHHNCLEVLILKGKAKDLELLSTSISGLRGVKLSRLSGIAFPEL